MADAQETSGPEPSGSAEPAFPLSSAAIPTEAGPSSLGFKIFLTGLSLFALWSGFSITGMQISLGIAFVGWCFCRWGQEVDCKPVPFVWAYLALIAAAVLSFVNAVDLWRAFTETKKFLIIIVFLMPFSARLSARDQRRILGLLILSGALAGGLGLLNSLKNVLGSDPNLDPRARGFYSMSITFGECQAIFLLTTLTWLKTAVTTRGEKTGLSLAATLQFLGLLASYTRGAFLGFAIGLSAMLRTRLKLLIALLITGVVIVGASAAVFRPSPDVYRLDSNKPESIGGNPRWTQWKNGIEFWKQCPIFGVGFNNVKPLYRKWLADHPEHPDKDVYGHLNSNFMQFLVTLGMVGFTAFLWLIVSVGRFCWRLPESLTDPWQKGLAEAAFLIWVTFIGMGFTEYSFADEELAMQVFFLIGLLACPLGRPAATPPES